MNNERYCLECACVLLTKVEVFPCVVFASSVDLFGDLLSLDEDALHEAGIVDSRFIHVDGTVREIVVNSALADSEVLVRVLHDALLEIAVKTQHLAIVLQPRRLHARDVVILRSTSLMGGECVRKVRRVCAHLLEP